MRVEDDNLFCATNKIQSDENVHRSRQKRFLACHKCRKRKGYFGINHKQHAISYHSTMRHICSIVYMVNVKYELIPYAEIWLRLWSHRIWSMELCSSKRMYTLLIDAFIATWLERMQLKREKWHSLFWRENKG